MNLERYHQRGLAMATSDVAPPSIPCSTGNSNVRPAREPIHAGEGWHLDHTDTRDGYVGVSHAACDLREGAHKTNARRRADPYVQQPYRWSQSWCENPPVGTVNLDRGRNPEI